MTPGDCFREAAEIAMAERRGLDANKAAWSNNPILTPDREYIDDWERRAEEGEHIAKAILARAAEEDQRSEAAPEAATLADAERYRWLRDHSVPPHNFYLSVPEEFKDERYTPQQVDAAIDACIAALRGKG